MLLYPIVDLSVLKLLPFAALTIGTVEMIPRMIPAMIVIMKLKTPLDTRITPLCLRLSPGDTKWWVHSLHSIFQCII